MTNLLEETIEAITEAGFTVEDVDLVTSNTGIATWQQFVAIADFEYDDGYGEVEITGSLEVWFGSHGKLIRGEYDGSEWWEFFSFARPNVSNAETLKCVKAHYYTACDCDTGKEKNDA